MLKFVFRRTWSSETRQRRDRVCRCTRFFVMFVVRHFHKQSTQMYIGHRYIELYPVQYEEMAAIVGLPAQPMGYGMGGMGGMVSLFLARSPRSLST